MSLIQPDLDLQKIIRKLINEDISTRDNYLAIIKDWMLQQPHLPDKWDDLRLMNFLRSCSFSLEKCKNRLDQYFSTRTAVPEFYSNRAISKNKELRRLSEIVAYPTMPGITENGYRITVYRANKTEYINVDDNFKLVLMLLDLRLGMELTGASGDIFILDGASLSISLVSQFTIEFVKKVVYNFFEAYPLKIKQFHVINSHPIIQTLFNLLKVFMKEKIRKRIYMHKDTESVYAYVPKELLPEEYGGNSGKIEELHKLWIEKLIENEPWFEEQDHIKTDESKRPENSRYRGELFGMDGSFAKLNID